MKNGINNLSLQKLFNGFSSANMKKQTKYTFILSVTLYLLPFLVLAEHHQGGHVEQAHEVAESPNQGGAVDTKVEIDAYMAHHLRDSHDFTFWSDGAAGTHVGFPLPVIFWDGGLKMFSSCLFDHGKSVAEVDGSRYALHHEKIYKLEEGASEVKLDAEHHPINAEKIKFDFSITKNVVGMLLTSVLLLLGFGSLARGYKTAEIPSGVGRILEPLVVYVRDEIAIPNIGKTYRKYMSFLLTVFFFIWLMNLLGITPLAFNVTGNIAVTACLALFTFIVVQFSANKAYWKHIFWMPGVPVPMKILLAPIELLGTLTKPFSLMIRLFANITAGHAVVMGLIAITVLAKAQLGVVGATGISFALTLFISLIEVLVAFLQAFIFTMLSSLFIGMAVAEHDEH